MKVALVSDLHLEFADLEIKNTESADVLVLAGDILTAQELHDFPAEDEPTIQINGMTRRDKAKMYREFLKRCSNEFPHVLYTAGNHEHYHGKWEQTLTTLRNECAKFPNVHFMENDTVVIDDVTFVGGTLWTDCNKGDPLTIHALSNGMNDYRTIRVESRGYGRLTPLDTIKRHIQTLEYIRKTVDSDPTKKYFVIGHHQPSKLSTKPQYENDYHINGGYSSDLSEFILDRSQIKVWVGGHTHHVFDYMIGETRICCNPRGYVFYERGSQEDDPYYPMIIEV